MPVLVKPTRLFSDALLQRYRQQGDAPADAVVAAVTAANGPTGLRQLMHWLADTADFSTGAQHPAVQDFFVQQAGLPAWADAGKMQRGIDLFPETRSDNWPDAGLLFITLHLSGSERRTGTLDNRTHKKRYRPTITGNGRMGVCRP